MIRINEKENCTGCYACANVCPQRCIMMQADHEGFWYPVVITEACTRCGSCVRVCPLLNRDTKTRSGKSAPPACAAYSREESIRLNSSSGGVFTLLAEEILGAGGVVFGACFDDKFSVVHHFVENRDELEKLRGSKYVQSKIGSSYEQARRFLQAGRTVLFSGTPCQIAGLKQYLGGDHIGLVCQDIICHGVPSPKAWKEYLAYREQRAGVRARRIAFRRKNRGWKQYSISFTFSNNMEYLETLDRDLYMRAFLKNICLRPSCYVCHFKTIDRTSDITLADFWGIQNVMPEMDDDKGTSLVIVHSEKGQELLSKIVDRLVLVSVELENAIRYNTAMIQSVTVHPYRDEFFKQLGTERIDRLIDRLCKDRFAERAKATTKSVLRRVLIKFGLFDTVRRLVRRD